MKHHVSNWLFRQIFFTYENGLVYLAIFFILQNVLVWCQTNHIFFFAFFALIIFLFTYYGLVCGCVGSRILYPIAPCTQRDKKLSNNIKEDKYPSYITMYGKIDNTNIKYTYQSLLNHAGKNRSKSKQIVAYFRSILSQTNYLICYMFYKLLNKVIVSR